MNIFLKWYTVYPINWDLIIANTVWIASDARVCAGYTPYEKKSRPKSIGLKYKK